MLYNSNGIVIILYELKFFMKVLKNKKKKLALTWLYCLGKKNWWFIKTNLYRPISYTWENLIMFIDTSKYFSYFNKMSPAN